MKIACFIPIKENSERVPGKNFRILNGKKLYEYICEHVAEAEAFDDVFIDTNSEEIDVYARKMGFQVIKRLPELASNSANGNDLLVYHYLQHPEYDYYFQLFATAPFLQPLTIKTCVNNLLLTQEYDSCFTATKNNGFFWMQNLPINYRPDILPRSQDLCPIYEETTGLYGISREALEKYRCRIGRKPLIYEISKFEAIDINTEEDLILAQYWSKNSK
ncbi:MAG: acylneuraminate cytidylyltransferase family protein [Spirochaetales bacterium]|nr:acylneuraminate cytidylyltransferase family protein [Spirochaetales bacterium]